MSNYYSCMGNVVCEVVFYLTR